MKDKSFLIKISDLLNERGKSDEIEFEERFIEQLPNLTKEGISGSLTMHSLDEHSLLGTLHDITCSVEDVCDSCGKSFVREIAIPEYTARFVEEDSIPKEEQESSEDVILTINPKNETIDIAEMILQAIILNDPFVKRCDMCEKKIEKEGDDEEDLGVFESKGNITFS